MQLEQAEAGIGATVAYFGSSYILIGKIAEVDGVFVYVNFDTVTRSGVVFDFPKRMPVYAHMLVFYHGPMMAKIIYDVLRLEGNTDRLMYTSQGE